MPNRVPPTGEPQWIDYVLVSHLPIAGPATLTSTGLAEVWERMVSVSMVTLFFGIRFALAFCVVSTESLLLS